MGSIYVKEIKRLRKLKRQSRIRNIGHKTQNRDKQIKKHNTERKYIIDV